MSAAGASSPALSGGRTMDVIMDGEEGQALAHLV